ncbi:endoplasmic reticulum protein SC65-like [Colossoma macropomum]|uniref:endoplasmic reticulum protein SC65-like n=1 Tax=Colossoma macropomum TaxID=42526 RepID=UPI001863D1C6|nr:endoplasmic reticulum protein SC65-like [Colossoma macropomum]
MAGVPWWSRWSCWAAAVLLLLLVRARAQYEGYSFSSFPESDLMPLDTAYGSALEFFGSARWKETVRLLELSLRIHRLLRESEAVCARNCSLEARGEESLESREPGLRVMESFLRRAACLKRCKAALPVFSKAFPRQDTLLAFQRREPYRYLQYAYYQVNNLEKAASAAHTYLQRNPGDPQLSKNLNYYKSLFDIEEFLIDQEEKPYESLFVKAVKLYNSGDFSRSVVEMERACEEYMQAYAVCLEVCEGSYELQDFKDFYNTLAGFYVDVLKCKVKCEENLMPNVGGYFVEKFVATMYHYLQFAYYKLNDVRNSAPCALSYMLFDPSDPVMKQNVEYYRFYREQWGLTEENFKPRPEALQYHNQTTKQKQMLEFAQNYLQPDDEDVVSPEEAAVGPSSPPDVEFEGLGDYEESFLAEWWQEPKTKGDTGEEE